VQGIGICVYKYILEEDKVEDEEILLARLVALHICHDPSPTRTPEHFTALLDQLGFQISN
jgi:hypothetical protein